MDNAPGFNAQKQLQNGSAGHSQLSCPAPVRHKSPRLPPLKKQLGFFLCAACALVRKRADRRSAPACAFSAAHLGPARSARFPPPAFSQVSPPRPGARCFFLKVSPGRSRASRSPLLCITPSPAPGRSCKTSPGNFRPENIPYPSPSSPACCESAPLSACTPRVLSLKSENKKQEAGLFVPGFLFYFVSAANRFSSCGRGPQKPRPQSAFFLSTASPFALRTKKQGPFCRPCLDAAAVHLTFLNPVCSLSSHPLWVLWFPVPIKIPPCSLFLSETSPIPQRTQPQ